MPARASAIWSAASPIRWTERARSATAPASPSKDSPLTEPPAIRCRPPSNASMPASAALTLVAFESLIQATPARSRTRSRRWGTPSKVRSPSATASAGQAARQRRGRRRHRVLDVVGPEQLELGGGQQRLPLPDEIAVHQRHLAARALACRTPPARPRRGARSARAGSSAVHDPDVARALVGEDAQLGVAVVLERPVAVQVVGREVQEDRALGREGRAVLELEAGALADDGGVGVDPIERQRRDRRPDVARRPRRAARPPGKGGRSARSSSSCRWCR